jgi:peptidoglycan/xylan/chitin deacetylase (PgdA/CDA1 family)
LALIAGMVIALVWALSGGGGGPKPNAAHALTSDNGSPGSAGPGDAAGTADATDRVLASTSYISVGGGRRREIALTFDDGPGPYTPQILDILRRMHAPATFFWIGRWVPRDRDVAAAEVRGGYPIGNHTQEHPPLGRLALDGQRREIAQGSGAVESLGLPRPRLFRPPYGSFDATTLNLLAQQRMLMVLWTVDTRDVSSPGADRIIYLAVSGARPGAIILMHDGGGNRRQTVTALPKIIRLLRKRRYRLVTIPQMLRDDPPRAGQPPPHSLAGR